MTDWSWLASPTGQAVLGELRDRDTTSAATIERCRRLADAETVRAAIALSEARRRARGKIDDAEQLLLDRVGVEQSTSTDVARHKARRFRRAGIDRVLDLCCGVGGDAIGFALEGITPILVDLDAVKLHAARHNVAHFLGSPPPTVRADVASLATSALPFHLDPDRRPDGRRTWSYSELLPGPEVIAARIASGAPGAVKLGPGVAFDDLPPGEIEVIQRGRGLVQAVLWTGSLAESARRATHLVGGEVRSLAGEPEPLPIGDSAAFLHTVEPAIERAGLLGTLARTHRLHAAHEHSGFLLGSAPVSSSWLHPERLLTTLPGRIEDVRKWLRGREAGVVTVRVRGGEDPRKWEKSLRGRGTARFVVHLSREGKKLRAWITEDANAPPTERSAARDEK